MIDRLDEEGFSTVHVVGGPQILDVETERPLATDLTYQRALSKVAAQAEEKRLAQLDASREEWLSDLPHTD